MRWIRCNKKFCSYKVSLKTLLAIMTKMWATSSTLNARQTNSQDLRVTKRAMRCKRRTKKNPCWITSEKQRTTTILRGKNCLMPRVRSSRPRGRNLHRGCFRIQPSINSYSRQKRTRCKISKRLLKRSKLNFKLMLTSKRNSIGKRWNSGIRRLLSSRKTSRGRKPVMNQLSIPSC